MDINFAKNTEWDKDGIERLAALEEECRLRSKEFAKRLPYMEYRDFENMTYTKERK